MSEAITERIGDKTASAKHKIIKEYKNSKNVLELWTTETKTSTAKKLKNVKAKFDHLSLKRNKARRSLSHEDDERPQTINIANDDVFQALSFNSPMNNQRSYNLENIPSHLASYEIPKGFKYKSQEDLPTYEDIIYDDSNQKDNTKKSHEIQNNLNKKSKNVSDSNLNTISNDLSDSDENDSLPPNIPAPKLLTMESPYGKLRQAPSPCFYENAPMLPLRKPPPPPVAKRSGTNMGHFSSDDSNRVTMCSTASESCTLTDVSSSAENTLNRNARGIDRSESWRFVQTDDNISQITITSNESDEPIYANDENERIGNFNSPSPLQPSKILNTNSLDRGTQSTITREILNEFDPLSRDSFDTYIMNTMNHFTLLETLLSEDTYGTVADSQSLLDVEQIDEGSSEDSNQIVQESLTPSPNKENEKSVSKNVNNPIPPIPSRKKPAQRQESVIIHQNLKLKDSIENLVEPFLARVEDQPSTSQNAPADLTKPKATRTNWFIDADDSNKFVKNNLDNPNNFTNMTKTDKVTKTVPQLSKVNNLSMNTSDTAYLPSYEESQNDMVVNRGGGEEEKAIENTVAKSKSTIFNFNLMRKNSLKDKNTKIDPKDFIPHPPFSDDVPNSHDKGIILFKLPSGVIEDMLKELNPRFIEFRKRQFKTFADPEFKVLKEHLDLTHLSSIHYLINHKFNDFKTECGRQIFCFEINLAIPKSTGNGNSLLDSKGSPVRTQRVTYVYGIHSKQEK